MAYQSSTVLVVMAAALLAALRAIGAPPKEHAPRDPASADARKSHAAGDTVDKSDRGDMGACCPGEPGGTCMEKTQAQCGVLGGEWLGLATDCTPDCCPVANPTGSDCACATSTCVVDADGTNTGLICDPANGGEICQAGQTCTLQCVPAGVTLLRHPYECYDDLNRPLDPAVECDPANGDADCAGIDPINRCEQSFAISTTTTRNDTIASTFGVLDGDSCTLNRFSGRIGWYELFTLEDPTPSKGTDDCFVLTVDLCCTDPARMPIWRFVSEFVNCPCVAMADVTGVTPDLDEKNNPKDGFGPASLANFPCDDGNYSATFTLPPGDYAYQVLADTRCEDSIFSCDSDDDCPGTACIVPDPDYTVHFTVESCEIGRCCVGETCIATNELDCTSQGGNYLGVTAPVCELGACSAGSCCLPGLCRDDADSDTLAECETLGGIFEGGVQCDIDPCPSCLFDSPANCQQVQTVFGAAPLIDRNPDNGFDGFTAQVTADDVKFGGDEVDNICWHTGFFATPFFSAHCIQDIDDTWEIRVYEDNGGIPGAEVGMSAITVLSKVEGTGQATGTWQYSGQLKSTIALPNGRLAGDTYWFEVSGLGEPGCETRATWSRDDGNNHAAFSTDDNPLHTYSPIQLLNIDLGFCEDSGLMNPGPVLGTCCTCPAICTPDVAHDECMEALEGTWRLGGSCSPNPCPGLPANDDCSSPFIVTGVPYFDELVIAGNNICATDDGPPLDAFGGCNGTGEMHNDVWYLYEGPCDELIIESCNDADFDQMIAVYNTTNGCPLTPLDEITCDDDGCARAGPSSVTWDIEEGDLLLIRVGGWDDGVSSLADPRGEFKLHFSLTPGRRAGLSFVPPILAPPPHDILKNRYISVDPRGEFGLNAQRKFYLRLTLAETLVDGVTPPMTFWATEPDENCISIVVPEQPSTPHRWHTCPTLHLTGCPIIPATTYWIESVGCDHTSGALVAQTQARPAESKWWGDAVGVFTGPVANPPNVWTAPQGVTNFDDVNAALLTFKDPGAVNATHVSVTDVHPNRPDLGGISVHPNLQVNIDDVFQFVKCFQGQEYLGGQLQLCTDP